MYMCVEEFQLFCMHVHTDTYIASYVDKKNRGFHVLSICMVLSYCTRAHSYTCIRICTYRDTYCTS